MKVVSIEEVEIGDVVVVQTSKHKVELYTVSEIHIDDNLLEFEGFAMDYAPNPNSIVILDDDF